MTTLTLIATTALPNERGGTGKPRVTLAWPDGTVEHFTLSDHDWSEDMWDWRNGRIPTSLTRRLFDVHFSADTVIHGERAAYTSPENVGTGTNEQGRAMVYEIDYEVPTRLFESEC